MTRQSPLGEDLQRKLWLEAMEAERYDERIAWAVRALDIGTDTDNLRILASFLLEKHPSPHEVDRLFRRCTDELGLPMRQRDEGLRQLLRLQAERYLGGTMDAKSFLQWAWKIKVKLNYPQAIEELLWFEVDLALGESLEELYPKLKNFAQIYLDATPKRHP